MSGNAPCPSGRADRGVVPVRPTVFDIKRYATHDGPGIRTTVFFKGCPLSCSWCHNPEGQGVTPELLVDFDRCVRCGACVAICPTGATASDGDVVRTDRTWCTACGRCVPVCPNTARSLVGRALHYEEFLEAVTADMLFYDESRGGVTFSGGEPLLQGDACLTLLAACKERGLHTALDTCGYAAADLMQAAARYTDLFLYDIKLIDGRRHREATGVSNEKILDNARALAAHGCRMWVRVPLVPEINDDASNLLSIARFVATLPTVEAVCLLPYHSGAERKRLGLGLAAHPAIAAVDAATAATARQLMQTCLHVPVRIGG